MALTKCDVPSNVIGSLATRAEERGLTPQEFKDKFDEMPEGIKQYINEVLTEEIDDHMAESASKHIRESGSNVNGSYIKFDDGTMICFSQFVLNDLPISAASGILYRSEPLTWTYPATFALIISAFGLANSNDSTLIGARALNNNIALAYDIMRGLTGTATVRVGLTAIGRWK